MPRLSRNSISLPVGLGVLAVFLFAACWYSLHGNTVHERSSVSTIPANWKSRLVHQAASMHSVLNQLDSQRFHGLGAATPIPPESRDRMRAALGPEMAELGISLSTGYLLKTRLGIDIWVVQGNSIACMFNAHNFAVSCDTAVNTVRHGLVSVSGPSPMAYKHPPVVALGIVPNGVRAVRLGVLGGRDRVVPVLNNTFALRAHRPIIVKGVVR